MQFVKYQAAGNDFIILDNKPLLPPNQIQFLTNRKFGIGADGVLFLSPLPQGDRLMRVFNPDGLEATGCGNGLRASFQFLHDCYGLQEMRIQSQHHLHVASIQKKGIRVDMGPAYPMKQLDEDIFFIDTGAPHLVVITSKMNRIAIDREAKNFQNLYRELGEFNVNFVTLIDQDIHIRTYEKGVDGETLACGTGAIAAAICLQKKHFFKACRVIPLSKEPLSLELTEKQIFLTGRAKKVFAGEVILQKEKTLV